MPKGYWLNIFRSINDPEKLAAYIKVAGPILRASGGKFLARGEPTKVYEAGLMMRTVVIEFESVEKAIAVYESPEYQATLQVLGDGAERDVRIVPGSE